MRASGVPARFEIGRSVPPESGAVAGYHCWADFQSGTTWIPVDASEAWKHPAPVGPAEGTAALNAR